MLENNRNGTNRQPLSHVKLNLANIEANRESYRVMNELERRNGKLAVLCEKLLSENSRLENRFLALKSSFFRVTVLNGKYYSGIKKLVEENRVLKRIAYKGKRIVEFIGAMEDRCIGDVLEKVAELSQIVDAEIEEGREGIVFGQNLDNSFNFTV